MKKIFAWALVDKKTGDARLLYTSRDAARGAKTADLTLVRVEVKAVENKK